MAQQFSRYSDGLRGRAVPQAVSLWLPTPAGRSRVPAEHEGFMVDKEALG
jgi:hypothetical protein